MREIIFRGKRVDNGERVEGFLFNYDGEYCIQLEGIECDDYGLYPRCYAEVIPETIGQYTGLTDKNGNKIFEGDIVEGLYYTAEDGGYGVVAFYDGAFEVVGSCDNNVVGTFHENYYGKDFEIIGNIHDNPELLEGESNEAD